MELRLTSRHSGVSGFVFYAPGGVVTDRYSRHDLTVNGGDVSTSELWYDTGAGRIYRLPTEYYSHLGRSIVIYPGAPPGIVFRIVGYGTFGLHLNAQMGSTYDEISPPDGLAIQIGGESYTANINDAVAIPVGWFDPNDALFPNANEGDLASFRMAARIKNKGLGSGNIIIRVHFGYEGSTADPIVIALSTHLGGLEERWFGFVAGANGGPNETRTPVLTYVVQLPDGTILTSQQTPRPFVSRTRSIDGESDDSETGGPPRVLSPGEVRRLGHAYRQARDAAIAQGANWNYADPRRIADIAHQFTVLQAAIASGGPIPSAATVTAAIAPIVSSDLLDLGAVSVNLASVRSDLVVKRTTAQVIAAAMPQRVEEDRNIGRAFRLMQNALLVRRDSRVLRYLNDTDPEHVEEAVAETPTDLELLISRSVLLATADNTENVLWELLNPATSATPGCLVNTTQREFAQDTACTIDWAVPIVGRTWHRFSIPQRSMVNLWLTGGGDAGDLYLRDSNGRMTHQSIKAGPSAESISSQLEAGSYTIEITRGYLDGEGSVSGSTTTGRIFLEVSPWSASRVDGTVSLQGRMDVMPVALFGYGGLSQNQIVETSISPNKTTWIVVHGMNSSPSWWTISDLTAAIAALATSDDQQVAVLDWRTAAEDGALTGDAQWTPVMGKWLAEQIGSLGISAADINLVGHSHGTYVSFYAAQSIVQTTGQDINSIVALEPAGNWPLLSGQDASSIDFGAVSRHSWAIDSSLIAGSDRLAETADISWKLWSPDLVSYVPWIAHSFAVTAFTAILSQEANAATALSRHMCLDKLLGREDSIGYAENVYSGGFEAELEVDLIGTVVDSDIRISAIPSRVRYFSLADGQEHWDDSDEYLA